MSGVMSDDYPEHLNPFDENYDPLATAIAAQPRAGNRQKYNTWNSNRHHQVATQSKPTLLERPWAALNISPKGKLVRRLSVLKTAVERFATKKKKRLEHSTSFNEANLPPRSNSLHEDFNYRIFSPKLKEKIRRQVFSRTTTTQEQEINSNEDECQSPQPNGPLTLTLKVDSECPKTEDCSPSPTSPESEKGSIPLSARPKTRKKRPPPPPPVEADRQVNVDVTKVQDRSDDNVSANSSITQDLEKDALTDDDNSLVESDQQPCQTANKKHKDVAC